MPDSLIKVLELIQPSHSLMRVANFIIFGRRLVLVVHGMHGKCCYLVVWDGKYRRKAARMMEGDGAALMSCWGDDGGKSEGGRRLVKEAKDGDKELCGHVETGRWERSSGMHGETDWEVWFLEENVRVQKLFLILDEHCSGRGDQSIAGGWGRTRDEFLFLDFVLKMEG